MRTIAHAVALCFLVSISSGAALADDWVAVKLRGPVFAFFDGNWVQLKRGAVVSGDEAVQTAARGYVTFVRGAETVALGPKTQVQILDEAGGEFTTVKQYFGTVSVEAQAQNVQHFAVRTPYAVAVVKGTKFVVTTGDSGTEVEVERGEVNVEATASRNSVAVIAGQSVATTPSGVMAVNGSGELPIVVDRRGNAVMTIDPLRSSVPPGGAIHPKGTSTSEGNNGNGNGGGNGNAGGNSDNGNSGNGNGGGNGNGNNGNGNGNGGSDGNAGNNGNGNGKGNDK